MQALGTQDETALERPDALAGAARVLNDPARDRPFNVLILGDSHSAADHISGALREALQARYGVSGRGVFHAGAPFEAYSTRQARPLFQDIGVTRGGDGDQGAGLTGFVGRAGHGSALIVSGDAPVEFDELTVCYLAEPGAAYVTLRLRDTELGLYIRDQPEGPRCDTVRTDQPTTYGSISIEDGPVRIFSWAATRSGGGGVSVSNLGVIGARAESLLSRDSRVLRAELDAYRPDLIVLAFGTNEGFDPGLDQVEYAASYREVLALLRGLAPDAALMIVGPPDAATVRPDLLNDGIDEPFDLCFPLSEAERADYAGMVARRDPALRRWYAPPALDQVREIQRAAAAELGLAFWDWEARMGGPCSIDRFYRAEPPAARGDHVHFNRVGGDLIGGWLADDLLAALTVPGGEGG